MVDGGVYRRADPKEKARIRKVAREWNRLAQEAENIAAKEGQKA